MAEGLRTDFCVQEGPRLCSLLPGHAAALPHGRCLRRARPGGSCSAGKLAFSSSAKNNVCVCVAAVSGSLKKRWLFSLVYK